jgi:hypothetical protein
MALAEMYQVTADEKHALQLSIGNDPSDALEQVPELWG